MNVVRKAYGCTHNVIRHFKQTGNIFTEFLVIPIIDKDDFDTKVEDIRSKGRVIVNGEKYLVSKVDILKREDGDLESVDIDNYRDVELHLVSILNLDIRAYTLPSKYSKEDNTCNYIQGTDGKFRVMLEQTFNYKKVLEYFVGILGNPKDIIIVETGRRTDSKVI